MRSSDQTDSPLAEVIDLRPRNPLHPGLIAGQISWSDGAGVLDQFNLTRDEAVHEWIDCCNEEIRTYHPGLGIMVRAAHRTAQSLVSIDGEQPVIFGLIAALSALSDACMWPSEIALLHGREWSRSRRPHRALTSRSHVEQAHAFSGVFTSPRGGHRLELHCDGRAFGSDPFCMTDALTVVAEAARRPGQERISSR